MNLGELKARLMGLFRAPFLFLSIVSSNRNYPMHDVDATVKLYREFESFVRLISTENWCPTSVHSLSKVV